MIEPDLRQGRARLNLAIHTFHFYPDTRRRQPNRPRLGEESVEV